MSGPCPSCQTIIQGPSYAAPPQPQPLHPPAQEVPLAQPTSPVEIEQADAPRPEAAPTPQPVASPRDEIAESQPQAAPQAKEPLFEEPAEQEPEAKPSARTSRRGGLSFLQALLLCFFFSVLFFALGFFSGKTGAISWEEILKQNKQIDGFNENVVEEINRPISQNPAVEINPLPEENEPAENDSSGAQASLEAFLSTGTWSARNAYVLFPNQILPEMEACAVVNGDGPIPVESITLKQSQPDLKVFWLKTENNPRPFSTVLIKDQGRWLVDWSAFVDFYHNRLQSFANGKEGPMHGVFRVFLKAAPGETAPLSPARCLVMAPQSETAFQVNSASDSSARKKLAEIFQAYLQSDSKSFKDAMSGPGIPLLVELSRNGAPNPTLQLVSIVATGWAPLPPGELKKDGLSSFY